MSQKLLAEFPAYSVFQPKLSRTVTDPRELPTIHAGVTFRAPFQTKRHGILWNGFIPGSVVSYAIRYAECPIEAIDHARKHGHKLHWINHAPVSITSESRPHETFEGLEIGQLVRFEGRVFRLIAEPNDNIGLAEE